MVTTIEIDYPVNFSFKRTAESHGWYDLPPFNYDPDAGLLSYVARIGGSVASVTFEDASEKLLVKFEGDGVEKEDIVSAVKHILRFDDELGAFYSIANVDKGLLWASELGAGRMLRSSTVWEDLVKTICTTNCSWALTRKMVVNLVEKLGDRSVGNKTAFPTAVAMAEMDVAFYRDEIRAGYRSQYFVELAGSVASGAVDPESWLTSDLPTPELKKQMKRVKGVGDYAAENLLKLVGRYDGLALDSFLRSGFYKKHNKGKPCDDKKIAGHYAKYGEWCGLAIWCDMTSHWYGH